MQMADPRRRQHRPAPAATACIETDGTTRQAIPGENSEILLKGPGLLFRRQPALVKALPFAAEVAHGLLVEIFDISLHTTPMPNYTPARRYTYSSQPEPNRPVEQGWTLRRTSSN